jgi:cytochrome c peroxidase
VRAAACVPLLFGLLVAAAAQSAAPPEYVWQLPRGFPLPAVPADNPMSDAKVALGARLFREPRLSVTGRYSCASCHDPGHSFADERPRALGATGALLPHHAMALVNVAYNISFGWTDRRPRTLEAQMLKPLFGAHPVELGLAGRESAVCAALAADSGYRQAFAAAFAGEPAALRFANIVRAIAAYERTLIAGRSPFDRYVFQGEHEALPPLARRGMTLFFSRRAGCAACHSGINFAGNWRDAHGATGPASFASNGTSAGAVRVPTLRNVALSAPYMHDGRFATLEEVLEHYSALAANPAPDAPRDPRLPRAPFTPDERRALIAFLESLSEGSLLGEPQKSPPVAAR